MLNVEIVPAKRTITSIILEKTVLRANAAKKFFIGLIPVWSASPG
jgi:hypothetical protein